ncbi:MAG: hypothetical protein K2Q25_06965 [Mycobacteriaceae bacterium]|nr:hypothetical protein [Mycobacteriaceae bacterium]
MKGFLAALSVIGAGAIFTVWTLIEVVTRLAPVLIVAVIGWVVVATVSAHGRHRRDDDRLHELWAQTPRTDAIRPPIQQPVAVPPPHTPHYQRPSLVREDDTGFTARRNYGYLNVCASTTPPAAAHQPRQPLPQRRCRRCTTRRSNRP